MKRILFIAGTRIEPTMCGGHLHTAYTARALARMGHDVVLYCLAGRKDDYPGRDFAEELEPRYTQEVHLGLGVGIRQTLSRRRGTPRQWQWEMLRRGRISQRLKQHLAWADLIISDMPIVPRIPGPWHDKPWFLLSHNLEWRLLQQGSPTEQRFVPWMQALETAAPRHYTDIFCCAEEDHDFFAAQPGGQERALPYIRSGVDGRRYVRDPSMRARMRAELGVADHERLVLFAGSQFAPNLEALDVLLRCVRAERDTIERMGIRILLLGSMCPEPYREGPIIATGRVPDALPYFAAADAGLNPVTSGSGANVKLFEYLAARLPVVSSRFGVRGTLLQAKEDYIPYDPDQPLMALQALCAATVEEWNDFAERVWRRHRGWIDMQALVEIAVQPLPAFH